MKKLKYQVFADRRWPPDTGIGVVQAELEARLPSDMELFDLRVGTRIGSPLSVLAIGLKLFWSAPAKGSVFFSAGFLPPWFSRIPVVLIVHDLTHLEYYGALKRLYYNVILRPLYRRCAAVICVSEFVMGEFIAWSGISPEKVHLVYNGVSFCFNSFGSKHKPGYPYILYVGNHRKYKNLIRLVEAYASSDLPSRNIRLLLTGTPDRSIVTRSKELSVHNHVIFLGWITQNDKLDYYRGALAIIYVSLFEGFGLPILEGFASGVPVLTSNVTSMPEIAGNAALLVDPFSVDGIKSGLERITTDRELRDSLICAGKNRLEDFSWDESANKTWDIVRDAASSVC